MGNVRAATTADAESIGRLMHRFNTEFGEPTPGPEQLAGRIGELLESGETAVLLAGEEPEGLLVVRFRPALWSSGQEAYIAELYVQPESRCRGLGGELMTATLELARERGCDWIHLGTDEGDADAHRLYERFGFSGLRDPSAPPDERERMFYFEREL